MVAVMPWRASEASTTAFGTTKRSTSVWVHNSQVYRCFGIGGGTGVKPLEGQLQTVNPCRT